MSNDSQSTGRDEPEGPLAGQRLAAARKERDISIFDIARELHLDEHKVQALEENRFDTLGAPVFAKGHLRKYAELVGVPIDDILVDYYALNRAVGVPPVVGRPRMRQRDIRPGRWIAGILALSIVIAAVYWWLGRDRSAPAPTAVSGTETRLTLPPSEAPAPVDTDSAATAELPPAASDPDVDDRGQTADVLSPAGDPAAAPAATVVETQPAAPSAGPQVTVEMRFSGDCWTEVSDASGARLFFDLGRAGRTVQVIGEPPLRVLFGNSDNVTVMVDGSDYPILDSMRRGQTARLSINN